MKIVILDGKGINPGDLKWDCIAACGDLTVYDKTPTDELTIERLQGADIAITNKTPINDAVLAACPTVKLICVLATGYNVVDCDAAAQRNIPVCNVPDYGTSAVAQFTFALLLEVCHQIGHHDRVVHQGKWTSCPSFCFWDTPQLELAGKTLGIIGFGRIGQAVAKIASAFGMKVLACSRTEKPGFESLCGFVSLDELLRVSDVVTIHCPLTPQTQGLINRDTLSLMKDGAILLNTSRGAVLDEAAVAEALTSGKLKAAAVDVACVEPIPADSPLLYAPNCIITPHMAWAPAESRQRILDCTVRSIQAFYAGNPINTVN